MTSWYLNMTIKTEVRKIPFGVACRKPNIGDPKWYVEVPDMEGVFSSGDTQEEAIENLIEAFKNHTLNNPITKEQELVMDNMGHMWSPGYQGFSFKVVSADLTVEV